MQTRADAQREYLDAICGATSGMQCVAFERLCDNLIAVGRAQAESAQLIDPAKVDDVLSGAA